jgi:thiol-disulfide isomerase/thioredoxin
MMAHKQKGAHSPSKSPPGISPQQRHKKGTRSMRKPVRRTPVWLPAAATIGAIALLVVAFLAIRWAITPPAPAPIDSTHAAAVLSTITSLPPSELEQVGLGSATNRLQSVSGPTLVGPGGKPLVFYFGAEYCPYCAAERWPVIIALSRFGAFSGLKATTSSSSDIYANTATFTFHGATYSSQYIEFQAVETTDRNQNPLDSPSEAQLALVSRFAADGSIPFVDLGNRYTFSGATYVPDSLQGMSWQQIADALQQADSVQAKAILGSANLIAAAICKLTSDLPAGVCSGAAIQSIEAKL